LGKLVTALRREGADAARRGRPWGLSLENRVLLVMAYWRTKLTMRQLAPLFGVSKSAADRIIDHLGPMLALQPRKRFAKDAVLIVDGTLIPTRNHVVSAQSKNYRYSKSHKQVRARVEHVFARMKTWKHAGQADLAAAHHVELFAEHTMRFLYARGRVRQLRRLRPGRRRGHRPEHQ
jgi:hypothetical protein